jgi:hypothetical protein
VRAFAVVHEAVRQPRARKCETVSPSWALLKVQPFFFKGVSVNLEHCDLRIEEPVSGVPTQNQDFAPSGPRIERCEFEQLLQRAMEILSARTKSASYPTPD